MSLIDLEQLSNFPNICAFDGFLDEFNKNILGKSLVERKRYTAWLQRCLFTLSDYKEAAVQFPHFEKLKGSKNGIYSIRYPHSTKNPRILYFFICAGRPVLLGAFLEKSSADYNKNLAVAEKRASFLSKNVPVDTGD